MRKVLIGLVAAVVSLGLLGCGENGPITVKRVDRDHFLVYDNDGYGATAALNRTCPAIGRSIQYYVAPRKHKVDALVVVCGR